MTSLHRLSAATFLFVLLAGASSVRSRQVTTKDGDLLVYYCQNLAMATVRVLPGRVEVATSTRRATLAETAQPSPVRYSDGTLTLSGLEELVRFEEPGSVHWCRSMPAEVPWQEARLRGIDFRAGGDDPAWSLEVDSGSAVAFAAGLDAARTVTKFPPVEFTGDDKRMTLTTKTGAQVLTAVAEQRTCYLAGSTNTLSVTATLDGKTYSGCGRRLTSR
jgi:hypothetical protein